MSQEVTTYNNNAVTAYSDDDFLSRLSDEAATFGGNLSFIKFDGNSGHFSHGQNNEDLPLGSHLVINHRSYKRGWIIWKGGKPVEQIMLPLEEGNPPGKHQLPDHGPYTKEEGPREQITLDVRMIEEPFTEMQLQANNKSKVIAMKNLLKNFTDGYKINRGKLAVIELDVTSFIIEEKDDNGTTTGRKFKKYAPVFKIIEWRTPDELNALMEGSPEDYEQGAEEQQALSAPEQQPQQQQQQARQQPAQRAPQQPQQRAPAQRQPAQNTGAPAASGTAPQRRSRF